MQKTSLAVVLLLNAICFAETSLDTLRVEPKKEIKRIEDNSFLIEEAYNQEDHIVQHVQNFMMIKDKLQYSFTQEWPVFGRKHQFSYVIPLQKDGTNPMGLADVQLNYRLQLVDTKEVALSPRLTVIAPTGDYTKGLGTGVVGYQVNLPVSVPVSDYFVTHFNVGATYTPNAKASTGATGNPMTFQYGASLVWLPSEKLNFLVEFLGTNEQVVKDVGGVENESNIYINPGLRFAIDFSKDLQVVPGISAPIKFNQSGNSIGVFAYLSIEHVY